MHVSAIQISNVRGFREVALDLRRPDGSLAGWTVIAGRNGSGKSSLLKAMALALSGPEAARALLPSFREWIRVGADDARVEVQLEASRDMEPQVLGLRWHRRGESEEPLLQADIPYDSPLELGETRPTGFDVYLSYQAADRAEVLEIARQLRERGVRVWIDVWNLKPGEEVKSALEEALNAAPVLAVLAGKGSTGRAEFQAREVKAFLRRGQPVIPVLLSSLHRPPGDVIPDDLHGRVWVDFRKTGYLEYDESPAPIDQLVWGITGRSPHGFDNLSMLRDAGRGGREKGFFAAYGPYRRLSGHAVDAQRLMEGPGPIARAVSLFREDASLVESVGWLREVYLQRLENKPGAAEVETAILNLLGDGLLPDGVEVEQVDSEGLWVRQQGVRLPLHEVSDGYRTVAALVMDVARHLYRHFGELPVERAEDAEGALWRVLPAGVVLIDEVDLHLHVSWQKRIGFWLKRHFPNLQFLVTTHSPFICQAADPRGLIRLPAPGEDRNAEMVADDLYNTVVHGSLDEAVLTELFGLETLYSEATERLRQEVARLEARLQTGEATDEERRELLVLRERLPRTMSSSVEQALRALAVEG